MAQYWDRGDGATDSEETSSIESGTTAGTPTSNRGWAVPYAASNFSSGYAPSSSSGRSSSPPLGAPVPTLDQSIFETTSAIPLTPTEEENQHTTNRSRDQEFFWCEFRRIMGCNRTFSFNEYDLWVDHHQEHLQRPGVDIHDVVFPSRLACWFCRDVPFDEGEGRFGYANFSRRMDHIREHLRHGNYTMAEMLDDDFMFEHLLRHGLIPEHERARVRARRIPGTAGAIPFDRPRSTRWLPEEMIRMKPYNEREERRRWNNKYRGILGRR